MSDVKPAVPRPGGTELLRPRRGLSSRLLILVVSSLAFTQTSFLLIGIGRETRRWLTDQVQAAELAVTALAQQGGAISPTTEARLLALLQASCVQATGGHGQTMRLCDPSGPAADAQRVDLPDQTISRYILLGLAEVAGTAHRPLTVSGDAGSGSWHLSVTSPHRPLSLFLRGYVCHFTLLMLVITLFTAALLYISLRIMVVQPMRRIASSIVAFRRDPERGLPLDTGRLSPISSDEIALAGQQLAAMQEELRTALWRNARLAAVGTAMAKMSHDLRGILSPAMLVADRLTMNKEQPVRNAGEVIVRAVQRATTLAQQTLDFVRLGPPALHRETVDLRRLVTDAAQAASDIAGRATAIRNRVPEALQAELDRESMLRVMTNLLRNAIEAKAGTIDVSADGQAPAIMLRVQDDGPGLPEPVRRALFRPFVSSSRSGGSGLGLSIARDLMRAHGGDLQLASTSPAGTEFLLYLQQPKPDPDQ